MDYTAALKDVIMETEAVTGGLTYRYVYGLEKLSVSVSPITAASTLPDNPNYYYSDTKKYNPVLIDGVHAIQGGYHNSASGSYAAMNIGSFGHNGEYVDSAQTIRYGEPSSSPAINLHKANTFNYSGSDGRNNSRSSEGCQIVYQPDYNDFLIAAGVVGPKGTDASSPTRVLGHYVVDRTYMPEWKKFLFHLI